jgi:hypothetical protein
MAADPQFASTLKLGAALLGAAETSLTVPTTTSIIVNAGANGTKVEEVVIHAATTTLIPTTVAGLVYLFFYDGANYRLWDTLAVTAVTPAAAGPAPFRLAKPYSNMLLPTGWSLRASQSIAGNANILVCGAVGGDF